MPTTKKRGRATPPRGRHTGGNRRAKSGLVPIPGVELAELDSLIPAKLNDQVYNPVREDDPDTITTANGLRATIDRFGIAAIDPIIVTLDNVILSGHRRRVALLLLGETHAPVRRLDIRSTDPDFAEFLVRYNTQRDKDPAVRVREQLVLTDPDEAYRVVRSQRVEKARVRVAPVQLNGYRGRSLISAAKQPFLDAVRRVLDDLADHWPLSDRRIHYALLNDPPLIHAKKPGSRYRNNHTSYKAVCDLLTRARLAGLIPFEAIGDETRPVSEWTVYPSVGPFVNREVANLFRRYWRDLMLGQPNHVEVVCEKMTAESTIRRVCADFTIPYTVGRGYCSLPPRKAMADRYRASGKAKLVILFLSDHDPEGEDIPETFARSMRDDFAVEDVHAVKVGLKAEQVRALSLPPNTEAKTSSSRFHRFAAKYGRHAYELEAVAPDLLQQWLREAICAVIDVDTFNAQVEREREDAATLAVYKREAADYLSRLTAG